ncbi:MAG: hypothetical protein QOC98_1760 [Frankiaceae bacterium]|nr:hypothetical protein [Frankiaceae bacterium]
MMQPRTTPGPGSDPARLLTPRTLALALAVVAAMAAGCDGAHPAATAASASPSAAPARVDDSTASVVEPSDAPSDPAGQPATGTAPPPGATAPDNAGPTSPQAASRSAGRTTPGIADGATALPPSAAVAPDGRCRTTALRLEPVDLQGSPGGTYANFRLLNTGRTSCSVKGFVGATLIGDDGKDIATAVRHEAGPEVWVSVAPRGSAQFHLRFPNPYSGEAPCNPPNAAKVRVTLTSNPGTLTGATPAGGIQACTGAVSTAPVGST